MLGIRLSALVAFFILSLPALGVDTDNDGIEDAGDNCSGVANADQRDTDWDGIGNACDGDLNDNCVVNFVDLGLMKDAIFTSEGDANWNPHADMNGSGVINFNDLALLKTGFFMPPGPSGRSTLCTGVNCAPVPKEYSIRWVEAPRAGEAVPDSSQITQACEDGVTIDVVTQGLTPGHAYTMWVGFFQNPGECHFPPVSPGWPEPTLSCGMLDYLFNTEADGNFRWGDGGIATGFDDTFTAFIAAGAPPLSECNIIGRPTINHCQGPQIGGAVMDEDTAILTHPHLAEYQVVLKDHGPEDPAHPDQVNTMDGGCAAGEPYFPCRDPQVAGTTSELGMECLEDPVCATGIVQSVGSPFAAGVGSGPLASVPDETIELRIVARSLDDPLMPSAASGNFTFVHYDALGDEASRFNGDIYCMSVSGATAFALGQVTEGGEDLVGDDRIVFTLEDNVNGDVSQVNVPGGPGGVPIVGTCDPQVVDVGIHSVSIDDGNYLVSD